MSQSLQELHKEKVITTWNTQPGIGVLTNYLWNDQPIGQIQFQVGTNLNPQYTTHNQLWSMELKIGFGLNWRK